MKTKITALLLLFSVTVFGQELDKPRKDRAFRSVITATKEERLSPKEKRSFLSSPKPYVEFRLVKLNEGQFFLRLEGSHGAGGLIIEKGQAATIRFTDSSELVLNAERRYAVHPSQLRNSEISNMQLRWENDYMLNTDAVATLRAREIKEIFVSGSRSFLYPVDPEKRNLISKALPVIGL